MRLDLGIVVLDLDALLAFFEQPVAVIIWDLFIIGGWLFFAYLFAFLAFYYLVEYKEEQYKKDWEWVVLAIDLPQMNEQTPKAVEQMFAHLAGAFDSPDIAGKFRHGYKQRWFSFEIISLEGYIQFIVRTEASLRDLVEAAIYAQYPDVDINEVEDYVDDVPLSYPNPTHDMWGADFGLAEDSAYPIRSYIEFEHSISKDTVLKDPMGTFLESFSRIGAGEQMWFQIMIEPISNSWKEKAIDVVKNLIGEAPASKKSNVFVEQLGNITRGIADDLSWQLSGAEYGSSSAGDSGSSEQNKLQYLTPGQKNLVEAIEKKISKIGFKTKIRGIYVAQKEVFNPNRGVQALIGAINQYNVPSSNSVVPTSGISASYFFKESREQAKKSAMMKSYKKRKIGTGGNPFIMNIEELATLWHFPMSYVKTPLLQKAVAKAVEPPSGLPIESLGADVAIPGLTDESLPNKIQRHSEDDDMHIDSGGDFKPGQQFG